jgi:hypothetical protein
VWSVATFGVLCTVAWLRWGSGYFCEFLAHVAKHVDLNSLATIPHTFVSIVKGQEFITTPDGTFAYQHDVFGYMENPLRFLSRVAEPVGLLLLLAFSIWLVMSKRGKRLSAERSFYLFLVVALLVNPLLWPMGLVACFPLVVALVDSSPAPNRSALLLLVPLFLTKQVIGNFNFTLWLAAAAFCVVQNGWLKEQAEPQPSLGTATPSATA